MGNPRKRSSWQRTDLGAAMRRLDGAYRTLAKARAYLAARSARGAPRATSAPWQDVLAAHRSELLSRPGVVGVGLGRRPSGAPAVAVFMREPAVEAIPRGLEHSLASPQARSLDRSLPARISAGRHELSVEVIPFGHLARSPAAGSAARGLERSIASARVDAARSVAPGHGIGQAAPATLGTLGALARLPSGELVGITAGHIADGAPPVSIVARSSLDTPHTGVIGELDLGTQTDIDAARIRFAAGVEPSWFVDTLGDLAGWRHPVPGDVRQTASLVGAVSGRLDGTVHAIHADFPAFSLRDMIVAELPTAEGDSGAALLDPDRFALGFLVGRSTAMDARLRLFSPAGPVLTFLGCNIP